MKIVSSSIKYFQSVEEEILVKCNDNNHRDFKETVSTMKRNGYFHDYIIKDGERIERFTKETKQQLL